MARMRNRSVVGTAVGALVALLLLGGCPNQLMESLEKMVSEATTTPHLALKCKNTSTVIQDDDTYPCSALLGTSNVLEFELRNSGDRDLIVDLIELVPGSGDVGDFDLTAGALPLAIAPGSADAFEVTFDPAAIGVKQVEVRILHNGPEGGGDFRFTLEGSAASTDASLSNLTVSEGTLDPSFSSGTLEYSVWVTNTVSTIQVTPTASSGDATITVNNTTVASGTASDSIDLVVGSNNKIEINVAAAGGGGNLGYIIWVTRASNDASLVNLQVTGVSLNETFASGTTEYSCSVPFETTSIDVTAYTNHSEATLEIDNYSVNSGEPYSFGLQTVGENTCTILVTAEDKVTTKTYTITITRLEQATLSSLTVKAVYPDDTGAVVLYPEFDSTTYVYYARSNAATESFDITPEASKSAAKIELNGNPIGSGTTDHKTAVVGRNDFTIVVTNGSGDTEDTRIYTLAVFVPLINLAVTGQRTSYRTGDDGALEHGIDWLDMTDDRFQENTELSPDVIIDDTFTNLEWVGNTAGSWTWADALNYAESAVVDKLDDWRLPNVNELESLLNYSQNTDIWLESLGFVNIVDASYWTSTTYLGDTSYAYSIDMRQGYFTRRLKTQSAYVLLVRDMD